jgi:hypothetical protein
MKETYGVEVGDKIVCHWENWEEDKNMKATGIVHEVDHNDSFSKDVATFRFKNYKGNDCWFCGCPTKIVKAKKS